MKITLFTQAPALCPRIGGSNPFSTSVGEFVKHEGLKKAISHITFREILIQQWWGVGGTSK